MQLEREAARQLTPDLRRRIHVVNYHGFFWQAVWANRRALGLPLDAQIGSRKQRTKAFAAVEPEAVRALRNHEGLVDSLAEHRFVAFHDDRTPDEATLERLLEVVRTEQRAGRLVFDDLGALFWTLLETYPTLAKGYASRYPVVIADEHQDASELQDAVVRRLGRVRRVILADPMQLIYAFRGSTPERLNRHIRECDERFELNTPHRWRESAESGRWLLAVRARLQGGADDTPAPASLRIVEVNAAHGLNAVKPHVKAAASQAFAEGLATVAVLAAWNNEVGELRAYLSREGMYPRHLGGADDFEEARTDIEQLPILTAPETVARHAIDRVCKLVPTLPGNVISQVKGRLRAEGVNLSGRCGVEARGLLTALQPLYEHGTGHYVHSVVDALDACCARGHHLPRMEAVRALRATADSLDTNDIELEAVLARYAENVMSASQAAPRLDRGLFVMSAHQSKGKEFDVVILVNVSEKQFPNNDEGRRLFYVTITRASRRWVIIAPNVEPSPLLRLLDAT
jgi:DNA helicase-2/ATP-dependent DNA helicase PcrA